VAQGACSDARGGGGAVTQEGCSDALCIADVAVVHQQGPLVGVCNHGVGHLPGSTEAQPVSLPCIVKLHTTHTFSCSQNTALHVQTHVCIMHATRGNSCIVKLQETDLLCSPYTALQVQSAIMPRSASCTR